MIPPPDSPFFWRSLTPADLPALAEIAAACHAVDGGLAFLNEPGILRERYFPDVPGATTGTFSDGERLVACSSIYSASGTGRERAVMVGQVHPEFRRRGLGDTLMRWSLTQTQALFGAEPTRERVLQIRTEALTEGARRLYGEHGFEPTFEELVMRRDLTLPLPDRPIPPEVTITTWEPGLDAQFFQAYHAAFRERPGFPGYSAEEWISGYKESENARPDWSFLARVENVPVGFLTGEAHTGGYIVQVGVIPEWRRGGLASALITETMRRMRDSGKRYAQLTVHLNNPGAIEAYLRLGFTEAGRRARFERKADPYPDAAT